VAGARGHQMPWGASQRPPIRPAAPELFNITEDREEACRPERRLKRTKSTRERRSSPRSSPGTSRPASRQTTPSRPRPGGSKFTPGRAVLARPPIGQGFPRDAKTGNAAGISFLTASIGSGSNATRNGWGLGPNLIGGTEETLCLSISGQRLSETCRAMQQLPVVLRVSANKL
jgi:hypothetical protein